MTAFGMAMERIARLRDEVASLTAQLKAARQRCSTLKAWNYALTYGASPHTAAEIIGAGADQYIEVDFAAAELRVAAAFGVAFVGAYRRAPRFLWGE